VVKPVVDIRHRYRDPGGPPLRPAGARGQARGTASETGDNT